jgi:prepilin-type N-terminal cleavage/methylation domain-containing protein
MKKWNSKSVVRHCHNSSTSPMNRQCGFSLIEFSITLVLLAVGATLSLPSYREMVEKQDLTQGAERVVAFVNTTQSESVARQQAFTLSFTQGLGGEWCFGAKSGDIACDCTEENSAAEDYCAIDSAPRLINSVNIENTLLTQIWNNKDSFIFNPGPAAVANTAGPLIVEMGSATENFQLAMVVTNSDPAILCLKDSSQSLSGYEACPADLAEQVDTESHL